MPLILRDAASRLLRAAINAGFDLRRYAMNPMLQRPVDLNQCFDHCEIDCDSLAGVPGD